MPIIDIGCQKDEIDEILGEWTVGSPIIDMDVGELTIMDSSCRIPDGCPFSATVTIIVKDSKVKKVVVKRIGKCTLE